MPGHFPGSPDVGGRDEEVDAPARRRLHPVREPHGLTCRGVSCCSRTNFARNHPNRVQADAQLQRHAVAALNLCGKLADFFLDRQGGKTHTKDVVFQRNRRAEDDPQAVAAYSTVSPPYRRATSAERSISAVMTSHRRSMSNADARPIERTTSAKSTVTCLYSADAVTGSSRVPHSVQNLPVECAPQESQIAVMRSVHRCHPGWRPHHQSSHRLVSDVCHYV